MTKEGFPWVLGGLVVKERNISTEIFNGSAWMAGPELPQKIVMIQRHSVSLMTKKEYLITGNQF